MVCSQKGIELLVNLINIAYCAMKVLSYQDDSFSRYRNKVHRKFVLHSVKAYTRKYFLPSSSQISKTVKTDMDY